MNFLSAIANQIAVATTQAEIYEETRKGRDFLGALLTSSADAIIATDLKGKITFFSREAEKILGYEAKEVLGQTLEKFISGGAEEFKQVWEPLEGAERLRVTEFETKDGRLVHMEVSVSPLRDAKGEAVGALGVCRDITAQRRLQEELSRTEKLAAVGQLTVGVMHEVLNPLSVISGRIQLLLVTKGLDPKVWASLDIMQKQVQRIANITEGLLRFSRRSEPKRVSVDINKCLDVVHNSASAKLPGDVHIFGFLVTPKAARR